MYVCVRAWPCVWCLCVCVCKRPIALSQSPCQMRYRGLGESFNMHHSTISRNQRAVCPPCVLYVVCTVDVCVCVPQCVHRPATLLHAWPGRVHTVTFHVCLPCEPRTEKMFYCSLCMCAFAWSWSVACAAMGHDLPCTPCLHKKQRLVLALGPEHL